MREPTSNSTNLLEPFTQCIKNSLVPYNKEISDLKQSLAGQQTFNHNHPHWAAFAKIFYDREAHLKDDLNQANFNYGVDLPIVSFRCLSTPIGR